jgi:6-phosphogluconate dehydrogenase
MVAECIAEDVPAPVISLSLIERLRSRDRNSYSSRLLANMRKKFGGHPIVTRP